MYSFLLTTAKTQKKIKLGVLCILFILFSIPVVAQQGSALMQKKISVQLKAVSVADALSAIGDQTGCNFSYSGNQINSDSIVSVDSIILQWKKPCVVCWEISCTVIV